MKAAKPTVETAIADGVAAAEAENVARRAEAVAALAQRMDITAAEAEDMAAGAEANYLSARRTQSLEAWQGWLLTLTDACYTN